MRAKTKADMVIRPAIEIENRGPAEHCGIVIGLTDQRHDAAARGDDSATNCDVGGGGTQRIVPGNRMHADEFIRMPAASAKQGQNSARH